MIGIENDLSQMVRSEGNFISSVGAVNKSVRINIMPPASRFRLVEISCVALCIMEMLKAIQGH